MSGHGYRSDLEHLDAALMSAFEEDGGAALARLRMRTQRAMSEPQAKAGWQSVFPARSVASAFAFAVAICVLLAGATALGVVVLGNHGLNPPRVVGPATSPSPVAECGQETGPYQALLPVPGASGASSYSFFDSQNPTQLTNLGPRNSMVRFVGASDYSWATARGIERAPVGKPGASHLNAPSVRVFGWSPDGQDVAWIEERGANYAATLLLQRGAAAPKVLTSGRQIPHAEAGPEVDERILYSPDGAYFVVSESGLGAIGPNPGSPIFFEVRRADGVLVWQPNERGLLTPSMPVWSRDSKSLYYNSPKDVSVLQLDTLAVTRVLPGTQWQDPARSFDGCHVAYVVRDSRDSSFGKPVMHILDLGTMDDRIISEDVSMPVFVSNSSIWAYREAVGPSGFAGGNAWFPNGALARINIVTGQSTDVGVSVVPAFFDTQRLDVRLRPGS
jgi:hypothetical protein